MARQTIEYRKKTTTRVKKGSSGGNGYVKCNMCGGTGYHKAPQRKKSGK